MYGKVCKLVGISWHCAKNALYSFSPEIDMPTIIVDESFSIWTCSFHHFIEFFISHLISKALKNFPHFIHRNVAIVIFIENTKKWIEILLIIQECPDRVIKSITMKPNILPKTLFHRFSPKFIKVYLTWAYFFALWPYGGH